MNKGKTWKPLAISWRLFPFLLVQVNSCFAWMSVGISFFRSAGDILFSFCEEVPDPANFLCFLAWKSWNVVTCAGCKSHLLGPVFRGGLRQTSHEKERRERSPLIAYWHWAAIQTVVSERILLLLTCVPNCILGTEGADPQCPCVCMRYFIHLSVQSSCVPRPNPVDIGWSSWNLLSAWFQSMLTCGSRRLSIHLFLAGFWTKSVMEFV